jgi:porphobilinogen synthase
MHEINYPDTLRRMRTSNHIRELVADLHLSHKQFIQPLFADESLTEPRLVQGLNNIYVETAETIITTIEQDVKNGITKFLIFPVPAKKAENNFDFSFATNLVKKIKQHFDDNIWLAVDVCLCSYTTHGHCGILNNTEDILINNETVKVLANYATKLAIAGADCIAPSDMMDGRIAAIRSSLNAFGLDGVSIISYSAKFSSQLYGPFRDACHSAPKARGLQNRKTYQLAPNTNEALSSALRDEQEGADILMVKPAALYTDVISTLKKNTLKPIAAYHVSGEYASVELLAQNGLAESNKALHLEVWRALTRSGASIIISYAARHAKQWIENMEY